METFSVFDFRKFEYTRMLQEYVPIIMRRKYGENVEVYSERKRNLLSWWREIRICLNGEEKEKLYVPDLHENLVYIRGTYFIPVFQACSSPFHTLQATTHKYQRRIFHTPLDHISVIAQPNPPIIFRMYGYPTFTDYLNDFLKNCYCSDENCKLNTSCKIFQRKRQRGIQRHRNIHWLNRQLFTSPLDKWVRAWYPDLFLCAIHVIKRLRNLNYTVNDWTQRYISAFASWLPAFIGTRKTRDKFVPYNSLFVPALGSPFQVMALLRVNDIGTYASFQYHESMKGRICPVSISDQEPTSYATLLTNVRIDEIGRIIPKGEDKWR